METIRLLKPMPGVCEGGDTVRARRKEEVLRLRDMLVILIISAVVIINMVCVIITANIVCGIRWIVRPSLYDYRRAMKRRQRTRTTVDGRNTAPLAKHDMERGYR